MRMHKRKKKRKGCFPYILRFGGSNHHPEVRTKMLDVKYEFYGFSGD